MVHLGGHGDPLTAGPEVPLLSCRGLCKYFGAMAAVKDLSFDVHRGEILGIGGPNGAGKTTLFELISGLNPTDRGEIRLESEAIHRLPAHAICHLGVARVFQSNAGFDTLSARDNVLIAAAYGPAGAAVPPLLYSAEIRDRAEAALALVGLTERGETVVRNLSVLDRKLLMVATAMATEPKLLLMDEPVGGLNPDEIDRIMKLVENLMGGGMTIMLIEHVMRFLVSLSDRVMIMHHGEKIYEGVATGLAQDDTVKSVYLGEKMSRRLADFVRPGGST